MVDERAQPFYRDDDESDDLFNSMKMQERTRDNRAENTSISRE